MKFENVSFKRALVCKTIFKMVLFKRKLNLY